MPYKITFDLPNLSKGQGVAIKGLGDFQNGESYEISDEDHDTYRIINTRQIDEYDDKDQPTGQVINELGPTLLQTNFQDGITVEKVGSSKKTKANEEQKGDDK